MGRGSCSKAGLNRGAWTAQEDWILTEYIKAHGEGGWRNLPQKAGLQRCGKSCRLRWLNYLKPGIKRGNISPDEEELIIRLHKLLGNRWSLIAGRLPGRTDNEIKNYWNTHLRKRIQNHQGSTWKCSAKPSFHNTKKAKKSAMEMVPKTALEPQSSAKSTAIKTKALRLSGVVSYPHTNTLQHLNASKGVMSPMDDGLLDGGFPLFDDSENDLLTLDFSFDFSTGSLSLSDLLGSDYPN